MRSVHRALADPLRIHLFELVSEQPRSAKELASLVGFPPDRLYHHLGQLVMAGLLDIAEYRKLAGGKVERVYAPATLEPPGEEAPPAEVAAFLGSMLEATRGDINAASLAQEAGRRREVQLGRTTIRLNEAHRDQLRARLEALVEEAQARPDEDGRWTTVVWTVIDREDR